MFDTNFFNPWFELSRCAPPRPASDDNTVVTYDPVHVTKNKSAILHSHGNVHFVKLAKLGDYVKYQLGEVLVCRVDEMRGLMVFGPENDPFMAVAREWFIASNTVRQSKRKGEGVVWPYLVTAVYEEKDWDYLISKAQAGAVPIPQQPVMAAPTAHAPVQPAMDDSDPLVALLNSSAATRKPEEPKEPAAETQSFVIDDALAMLERRPPKAPADPPAATRKPEEPKKPDVETQSSDIDDILAMLERRPPKATVDPPTESESVTPMPRRERRERFVVPERPVILDEDGNDLTATTEAAEAESVGSRLRSEFSRRLAEVTAKEAAEAELMAQEHGKRAAKQRKKQPGTGLFGFGKKNVATIAATSSMDEDW